MTPVVTQIFDIVVDFDPMRSDEVTGQIMRRAHAEKC